MEAEERPPLSGALVLLTVFAVLGGFLFGYDTGVVSGAEVFVQNDLGLSFPDVFPMKHEI